jgi:HEAT repeat protein
MQSIRAQCCALVAGLSMLGSAGCASTQQLATWWPWYEPDQTADLAQYGPISRQKIESLKELQKPRTPGANEDSLLADQVQHESDPLVRLHIVRALAQYQTPTADAALYAALKDNDVDVRIEACNAWGRRGGPDASRVLGEALAGDTSVDVRIAAAKALGEMRDPQAVPLLAVALEDPDPALQFRAVEAMRLASGKDLGNDVNRWREFAKNPDMNAPNESLARRLGRLF